MKKIWVVTFPNALSIADDLYFECDGIRLELQFKGGLLGSDIEGFYLNASHAAARADELIQDRDNKGLK